MMNHNERKYLFLINFVTPVTRVWGILTVVVFWGVGVDVALHGHKLGIYIILSAIILTFLETMFVVFLFFEASFRDENKDKCFRCWKQLQWLDQWRKSLLYLGMSVLCFIRPSTVWLAIVAGVMLITLAILYLLMTCREKLEPRKPVLFEREASYDRFNDLQDEIDDSLPEPGNINE
ncbi:transmembrane protein 72-like isoform X2 [Tachypleus tridentatus]